MVILVGSKENSFVRNFAFFLCFSLCISCLSSSLSFWALTILCISDGSFRSLLKENAGADADRLLFDEIRVFAFSDISLASLSGREGGTLSVGAGGASLTGVSDVLWCCLPVSAGRCVCSCKSSAEGAATGPELSGEVIDSLGCTLGCLLSSEGRRRRGDRSPGREGVVPVWLDVVGFSRSETVDSTGASEAALAGDLGVRERVDSRPGATLGLMENRFLLWTAAEALVPSPF